MAGGTAEAMAAADALVGKAESPGENVAIALKTMPQPIVKAVSRTPTAKKTRPPAIYLLRGMASPLPHIVSLNTC